jgi:hypothetical protein
VAAAQDGRAGVLHLNGRPGRTCPGWKPHRRDLLDPPKCGEGAWPWPVSCRIRSRSLRTTSGRKFDCPPARDIEVARVLDRWSGDRPRSGRALIVVVEPADLRDRHHTSAPRRLPRAGQGRILLQRLMGSHRVVQVDNQIPIGSSPEKSGIRGTRGTAVPCGLIRPSSGVGGRCSSADWSCARTAIGRSAAMDVRGGQLPLDAPGADPLRELGGVTGAAGTAVLRNTARGSR